jgi:hypothetical protein
VVRPSPLGAGSAFAGAACVALVVVLYGAVQVDVLWSVLAGVAGVGVCVLVLRGFPLLGVVALALSAFLWGLAMRAWLPASATDLVGDLRFAGGNLAFVVPLAGAFLLAVALDAHRVSRAAIDEALSGRRWWGGAETRPAPLRELEALPAARFFALAEGPCSHVVSVSRRVALVLPAAWPEGGYTVDADGRVLRDGLADEGASAGLDGLVAAMDTWRGRLEGTGATLRGFLVVSPTAGPKVVLDVASGQHLQIVHGHEFPEAAGGWLAAEPYRIDLAVTERLLGILGDPSAAPLPAGAPPGRRAPAGRRRARTARGAAPRSGTPEKSGQDPARTSAWRRTDAPTGAAEPSAAETAGELAPGWDAESAQRLADWASGVPPTAPAAPDTEWWKDPLPVDPRREA